MIHLTCLISALGVSFTKFRITRPSNHFFLRAARGLSSSGTPPPHAGDPARFLKIGLPLYDWFSFCTRSARRWLFVKSKTSVFEWVVDARFFRTPLFIAGAPGPPKGTATEKQPVKSPVEDLNHNSEWSFAMIAWTRKEPRTRRNPPI